MNSNNTKTLLVTTALAVRMLSIAQSLSATQVMDEEKKIEKDVEFEGFKIEHEHAEYGTQCVLVDQIHPKLYSVSFVGHEKYLEMIGTQGWTSSAEALLNYLCDLNPELELSLNEFVCTEVGDNYIVYSLASEDELDLNDQSLAELFLKDLFVQVGEEVASIIEALPAGEEIIRTVEDSVQTDAINETLDAGSQTADHPEDVDSPEVAGCRKRVMKFIKSPYGIAAATVVVSLATLAGLSLLRKAPDEVTEALLG